MCSHAWGLTRISEHKSWLNKLFCGALQRGDNRIKSVSLQDSELESQLLKDK